MKRSFSDISGLPANDAIQFADISYRHTLRNGAQIVLKATLSMENSPTGQTTPDLTNDDLIFLLNRLVTTFVPPPSS